MRSAQEIIARIEAIRPNDPLGFEWPFYLNSLTFEQAKPYLKKDYVGDDWKVVSEEEVRAEAIGYMAFAWQKANRFRGISAWRSIAHYTAWLWLLGVDWVDSLLEEYEFYGKPQLVRICEYLGLDSKQWDDGVRANEEPSLRQYVDPMRDA